MKDQIKEVEELREEHNELYNEITRWATVVIVVIHNVLLNHSGKKITGENICRCFGNEKCLAEFELLDMSPGSKLHGLGNLLCTLF